MRRVLTLVVVSLLGCGTWSDLATDTKTLPPLKGAREVRAPMLAPPRAATTASDARLRLDAKQVTIDFEPSATCRTVLRKRSEKSERQRFKFKQTQGWVLLAVAALGAVATGFLLSTGEDDVNAIGLMTAGGAVWGGQVYLSSRDTKTRTKKTIVDDGTGFEDSPCGTEAVKLPARVALTTPWGQKVEAAVEGTKARFAVDWTGTGIDKKTSVAEARAKVAGKWLVTAAGFSDLALTPDAPIVDGMVAAVGDAIHYSITCPNDGASQLVVLQPDNQTLRAGERNQFPVTVVNKGSGTSCEAVLDLVFDDPALPTKQNIVIGRIVPNGRETVTVTLDPPRNAAGKQGIGMIATASDSKRAKSPEILTTIDLIAADRPLLGVACRFTAGVLKGDQGRLLVDAGDTFTATCSVTNNGKGLAPNINVVFDLRKTTDGKHLEDSSVPETPFSAKHAGDLVNLAAGKSGDVAANFTIPADAHKLDRFELFARATDGTFGTFGTSSTLKLEPGVVDLCRGRKLEQAEYERERQAIQVTYKNNPDLLKRMLIKFAVCRKT